MNTPQSNASAPALRNLHIQHLRAQAEVLRLKGEALSRQLVRAITDEQKAIIVREWERTTWARHSAKLQADRLASDTSTKIG